MSYKNFTTAVYCTVGDVNNIKDLGEFEKDFAHIEGHAHIDKVYLEPGEKKNVTVGITDGVIAGREYFAVV